MEYFRKQNVRVFAVDVTYGTIVLIDPFIKIILLSRMFGCPRLSRARNSFFFAPQSVSRARLRVANAGQFPRCRRGRHRTALPRSVIARSAALFFVFLFRLRAGARGWRGSRRESSKNHAFRDAVAGIRAERHWFPIFPQRDVSIGRTQSSRLIKQHANSANSYILKRARR